MDNNNQNSLDMAADLWVSVAALFTVFFILMDI